MSRWLAALMTMALLSGACGDPQELSTPPGLEPGRGNALTAEWRAIAPALEAPADDRDASPCHRGEAACLEAVLIEMEARLDARPCAHTAPFTFTYLQMTRGVADTLDLFDEPVTISLVDARFAQQYFDAFDNWFAGRAEHVPTAWQIAFDTAEAQQVPAALDLILGMNAHISRDLPYIVAEAVERRESGEEPEDYRFVNDIIGDVKSPMLAAAAERFDPNLFLLDAELPGEDAPDPVDLIAAWRSVAFDMGRRLAEAETPAERDVAIAEIERTAAAGASVLVAASSAEGITDLAGNLAGGEFMGASFLEPDERLAYCRRGG